MMNEQECEREKKLLSVFRQYRNIYLKSIIYSVNIVPSGGYLNLTTPSPDTSTH
jgi:hypothetical protein